MFADHQTPIYHLQKLPFENIELCHCDTTDFGIEIVWAECIAKTFAGYGDWSDDETMTGQRGQCKPGRTRADLINVEQ